MVELEAGWSAEVVASESDVVAIISAAVVKVGPSVGSVVAETQTVVT
jgi:hypothetical protein